MVRVSARVSVTSLSWTNEWRVKTITRKSGSTSRSVLSSMTSVRNLVRVPLELLSSETRTPPSEEKLCPYEERTQETRIWVRSRSDSAIHVLLRGRGRLLLNTPIDSLALLGADLGGGHRHLRRWARVGVGVSLGRG